MLKFSNLKRIFFVITLYWDVRRPPPPLLAYMGEVGFCVLSGKGVKEKPRTLVENGLGPMCTVKNKNYVHCKQKLCVL